MSKSGNSPKTKEYHSLLHIRPTSTLNIHLFTLNPLFPRLVRGVIDTDIRRPRVGSHRRFAGDFVDGVAFSAARGVVGAEALF